ncbi:unnamed protein product, partial [Laminaria digitata]
MLRFMLFATTAMTVAVNGIASASAQAVEDAASQAPSEGAEEEVRL